MRHDSSKPLPILRESWLLNFYYRFTALPDTRNWGIGVWGTYTDNTRYGEQISGSRIARAEYSARSRIHPSQGHSGSRPPTRSIRPFVLEVEVGRPDQWQLARRALLPEKSRHEVHLHSAIMTIMGHPLPRVGEVMDMDCGRPRFKGCL